jgi:outer membrane protein assembly factor BamE
LLEDSKKYHADYPVNETEGDKSEKPKQDDGGFGAGASNGGDNNDDGQ